MLSLHPINVTPDALVSKHGTDAIRIVSVLIEHAIGERRHDEALALDRVRRAVKQKLAG